MYTFFLASRSSPAEQEERQLSYIWKRIPSGLTERIEADNPRHVEDRFNHVARLKRPSNFAVQQKTVRSEWKH